MWLAIPTRPDRSNAVRSFERYCSTPTAIHRKAAIGILAYFNGTFDFGLTYQRGTLASVSFDVFADADYASKATDKRSVPGGAIMCGEAPVRGCRTFHFFRTIRAQYNPRKTRYRTQIRSTLTFITIF